MQINKNIEVLQSFYALIVSCILRKTNTGTLFSPSTSISFEFLKHSIIFINSFLDDN